MKIFTTPMPPIPRHKEAYNPSAQGDIIRRIEQVSQLLQKLTALLQKYTETDLVDATGKTYEVLAISKGATPLSSAPQPFSLEVVSGDTPKIRIYASTLAGGTSSELGFVDGVKLFDPAAGKVYGKVTHSATTGEISKREILLNSPMPADTDTICCVEIGTVSADGKGGWKVSNSRYGPINAAICRNWFAATSPFFTVFWS